MLPRMSNGRSLKLQKARNTALPETRKRPNSPANLHLPTCSLPNSYPVTIAS